MFRKIINNKEGLTLLELTVAVAIFSVMMLALTQIFNMVIRGQRNAIAAQNIQESMRYAMEVMSKEIRMAQKDVGGPGQCPLVGNGDVYSINAQGDKLYLKNYQGKCVTYSLNGTRLEIERNGISNFITPDEIKVSNLAFSIVDNVGVDQSMVTMKMDIEAVGKAMHKQSVTLQTTISARYYE